MVAEVVATAVAYEGDLKLACASTSSPLLSSGLLPYSDIKFK